MKIILVLLSMLFFGTVQAVFVSATTTLKSNVKVLFFLHSKATTQRILYKNNSMLG